jgi:hypothetical protein
VNVEPLPEDQPRLLGEHVAVDRRYLDAARPQSLDHRVHLVCGRHEIAVMAALPPPVGWKPVPVATPVGPAGLSCLPSSLIGSRRGILN